MDGGEIGNIDRLDVNYVFESKKDKCDLRHRDRILVFYAAV
jgi:hypothetical protein